MPPVIAAGVAAAGAAIAAIDIGAILVSTAISVGLSVAARALMPEAEKPQLPATRSTAPVNAGRSILTRQAVPPRRLAYGRMRLGGAAFFQQVANPYLYLGAVLSDGQIQAVDSVFYATRGVPVDELGDVLRGPYLGNFLMRWAEGDPDQTALGLLTSDFPSLVDANFRQRGVARAVVRMKWGTDAEEHTALWGESVAPAFGGRWMRCYDPREGSQSLSSPETWEYTANPILCIAHMLTHCWDLAISSDDIDWVGVAEEAEYCDTIVSLDGYDFPIFELAGVVQADAPIVQQVADMLSACNGALTYADGLFLPRADRPADSVWTITDDDVIGEGVDYAAAAPRAMVPNVVKATFADALDGGNRRTTTPYELAGAVAADGWTKEVPIDLPFTPSSVSAQVIAYRRLMQARDGRGLVFDTHDGGLFLRPNDVVTFSSVEMPWASGDYRVQLVEVLNSGCRLHLTGYATSAYVDPTTYIVP